MKDKIITTIAYLFSKRPFTYLTILILSVYMIVTTTVNHQVKQKIEIEKLNVKKIEFIIKIQNSKYFFV